tara:strand:- start:1124 stop:1555 length:432 start_codon:yes stop_codon:yes gene_type:complete
LHKLNPHTLFSIFEQGDEEIYKEHNAEDVLNNPYVLIGMVVTGVDNFHLLDKMYLLKHQEDYSRVRENVKLKFYNRLFRHLKRIEVESVRDVYDIGLDYDIDASLECLNDMLYFYERLEMYEKCAIVMQFTDLLYGKKLEAIL